MKSDKRTSKSGTRSASKKAKARNVVQMTIPKMNIEEIVARTIEEQVKGKYRRRSTR